MKKNSILQIAGNFFSARFALALALLFVGSVGFYACQQHDTASNEVTPNTPRNTRGNKNNNSLATRLSQNTHFIAYANATVAVSVKAEQTMGNYSSTRLTQVENSINALGTNASLEDVANITGCSVQVFETQTDVMQDKWNLVLQDFPELLSLTKENFEASVGEGYNMVIESASPCGEMFAGCRQAVAVIAAWEISHGNPFGGFLGFVIGTVKCTIGFIRCILS